MNGYRNYSKTTTPTGLGNIAAKIYSDGSIEQQALKAATKLYFFMH